MTGEELQKARDDAGLTQEEVAKKCGVHRTTVVSWEGKAYVKGHKAIRYLNAVRELARERAA